VPIFPFSRLFQCLELLSGHLSKNWNFRGRPWVAIARPIYALRGYDGQAACRRTKRHNALCRSPTCHAVAKRRRKATRGCAWKAEGPAKPPGRSMGQRCITRAVMRRWTVGARVSARRIQTRHRASCPQSDGGAMGGVEGQKNIIL